MITILNYETGETIIEHAPVGIVDIEQWLEAEGYDLSNIHWMSNVTLKINL